MLSFRRFLSVLTLLSIGALTGAWTQIPHSSGQSSAEFAEVAQALSGVYDGRLAVAGSYDPYAFDAQASLKVIGGELRLQITPDIAPGCDSVIGAVQSVDRRWLPDDSYTLIFDFLPVGCQQHIPTRRLVVNAFNVHSGRPGLSISLNLGQRHTRQGPWPIDREGLFERR